MVTAAGEVTGTLTVAAGSVHTKNNMRDKDLRSAKLFDIARHPYITTPSMAYRPPAGASG